jgi:hypothetical protein
MNDKQLGIIKNVRYGLRDIGRPCLSFTVYTDSMSSSLQCFTIQKDIDKILKDANAEDIRDMEGKSCWVKIENNMVHFIEMSGI